MKTTRILILEDDLETLSVLLRKLHELEDETSSSISVVTLSEYTQVEEFINNKPDFNFDIILLDRDCKASGSFHILNIEKYGPQKVISISSMPNYNQQAQDRGVQRVVWKDYLNLEDFGFKVIENIKQMLS